MTRTVSGRHSVTKASRTWRYWKAPSFNWPIKRFRWRGDVARTSCSAPKNALTNGAAESGVT
jgi:hypothetical protein